MFLWLDGRTKYNALRIIRNGAGEKKHIGIHSDVNDNKMFYAVHQRNKTNALKIIRDTSWEK
jgi:hypothetical protein